MYLRQKHKPFLVTLLLMMLFSMPALAGEKHMQYSVADHFSVGILIRDSVHSPNKAAILSALLPGAGQAYNRKYWKIPVVYGAGFVGAYYIKTNHASYKTFREAYIFRTDTLPSTIDDFPANSAQQLQVYRDAYRRKLELSVMLTGAVYLLQILDATVDAYLFDFDVSNNIGMSFSPKLFPIANSNLIFATGLSLSVTFRAPRIKRLDYYNPGFYGSFRMPGIPARE